LITKAVTFNGNLIQHGLGVAAARRKFVKRP
jgi:hypothetical protein